MPVQISNSENIFSMLRLLWLDSIVNAKRSHPFIADIIFKSRQNEMDNIINKLHSTICNLVFKTIAKFKK